MESIRTNRILPAYLDNKMDWQKVKEYAEEMKLNDLNEGHNGFPPIQGFYDVVTKEDLGMYFNYAVEDSFKQERVTKKHIGTQIFRVTDGNHRTCAAQIAEIYILETEKDLSGFVMN